MFTANAPHVLVSSFIPEGSVRGHSAKVAVVDAEAIISPGIKPGTIVVSEAWDDWRLPLQGACGSRIFQCGDVLLHFNQILSVDFKYSQSPRGEVIVRYKYRDFRWGWQYAEPITMHVNLRDRNGKVIPKTEMSPIDIMERLMKGKGVTDPSKYALQHSRSAFPIPEALNKKRPEFHWVDVNPAVALKMLTDSLGCLICPTWRPESPDSKKFYLDSVNIQPKNRGTTAQDAIRAGIGDDPLEDSYLADETRDDATSRQVTHDRSVKGRLKPDRVMVAGGPVVYQSKFYLEPVYLSTKGEVFPLIGSGLPTAGGDAPLKYKEQKIHDDETGEWNFGSFDEFQEEIKRLLADSHFKNWGMSFLRWYRIRGLAHEASYEDTLDESSNIAPPEYDWEIPGREAMNKLRLGDRDSSYFGEISGLHNIRPLFPTLNSSVTDWDGSTSPERAYIQGQWPEEGEFGVKATAAWAKYPGSFSIKSDHGIVVFPEPMYAIWSEHSLEPIRDMYLTCTHHIVDDDGNTDSTRVTGKLLNPDMDDCMKDRKYHVIRDPSLTLKVTAQYKDDADMLKPGHNWADNGKEVEAQADDQMQHIEESILGQDTVKQSTRRLAGLEPVDTSGRTLQVSYQVGRNGAFTTYSQGTQHDYRFKTLEDNLWSGEEHSESDIEHNKRIQRDWKQRRMSSDRFGDTGTVKVVNLE
tara:strand:+ start:5865 stop:7940 length:2076 start_codon:yes stop_codon:yes gene_type:complete